MKAFNVKVETATGQQVVVEVRATGQKDAARKALWRFLPGAVVVWVNPLRVTR